MKLLRFLFKLAILAGIIFAIYQGINYLREKNRIAQIKEGWYVEITTDDLPVRDAPDRYNGHKKGTVSSGEIYEAIDFENGADYYWYKIKWNNGWGWVAQIKKNGANLTSYNYDIDVATPTIAFKNNEYSVVSIDDINTKHLTAWDDQDDYKITYIVCHEYESPTNPDQYWIKWTITDASGKYSSKIQKIIFEVTPDESKVYEFYEYCK